MIIILLFKISYLQLGEKYIFLNFANYSGFPNLVKVRLGFYSDLNELNSLVNNDTRALNCR
jgi:hypothetical protein